MKSFEIFNGEKTINVDYPTSLDEITTDWLEKVTEKVIPAPNYSLIALVYRENIATVIMSYKQKKKGFDTPVVPLFVKHGETTTDFIADIEIKDKLLIPVSALVNAHHVVCPDNNLSISKLISLVSSDFSASKRALENNFTACFVEFKIVQNFDIVADYKK